MSELTQQGISALKAGDKRSAVQLLRLALQNNPKDIDALLWLSGAVDTDQERSECLQAILRIDSNNQVAAQGLAHLVAKGSVTLQAVASNNIAGNSTRSTEREKNNREQEVVIFKDHPSWGFMLLGLGLLALLFGILIFYSSKIDSSGLLFQLVACPSLIAFLVVAITFAATWSTSKYILTNKKLIVEKGLFTHQRRIIPLEKIQDVGYHRVFIQILFGVGDVIVESAGEKGQVVLRHLARFRERSETILSFVQKQ